MQITVKRSSLLKAYMLVAFTLLIFIISSLSMYLTFTAMYWAGNLISSFASLSAWIISFAICSKGLWHLALRLSSAANRRYSR
ncbi:MAG: hypothetical protein ACE5KU_04965 [Nitrososphaerales archaeon]